MRVAVLIKQVPRTDQLCLAGGRLVREGVEMEVNAFCRRANAKAVELAGDDGDVVVFTMGPPDADQALREMLACGASRGVHLCDPAFAGSDTLATARALATAITAFGPFDLVLCGLNSLDADTGQVGPEVAELLGLPFAPGVRELDVVGRGFHARLETDDGFRSVEGELPVVLSTAERLCDPSKAPPNASAAVAGDRISLVTATALGLAAADVGVGGSPTSVGATRLHETTRRGWRATSVAHALELLDDLGALDATTTPAGAEVVATTGGDGHAAEVVATTGGDGHAVWCFLEPEPEREGRELLGEAARLASVVGGAVTALVPEPVPAGLGPAGADHVVAIVDGHEPEQWARALAAAASRAQPWALLIEGTRKGRAVAAAVAARCGWGLTGDAIELEVSATGRLVAWKPAFGGQLIAPIESRSPVQMVTIRPGVLPRRGGRLAADPVPSSFRAGGPARIVTTASVCDDDGVGELLRASGVLGVGTGVEPDAYLLLEPLRLALGGSPLAATRRVTDRGWLPRSRQLGVTGHAIAPRLYVAVGISGKLNHMVGVRAAGTVLAINDDPDAPVFGQADVGLLGRWQEIVPELAEALTSPALAPVTGA